MNSNEIYNLNETIAQSLGEIEYSGAPRAIIPDLQGH